VCLRGGPNPRPEALGSGSSSGLANSYIDETIPSCRTIVEGGFWVTATQNQNCRPDPSRRRSGQEVAATKANSAGARFVAAAFLP